MQEQKQPKKHVDKRNLYLSKEGGRRGIGLRLLPFPVPGARGRLTTTDVPCDSASYQWF